VPCSPSVYSPVANISLTPSLAAHRVLLGKLYMQLHQVSPEWTPVPATTFRCASAGQCAGRSQIWISRFWYEGVPIRQIERQNSPLAVAILVVTASARHNNSSGDFASLLIAADTIACRLMIARARFRHRLCSIKRSATLAEFDRSTSSFRHRIVTSAAADERD
jgi:hypothetical protein